jgi:hypothetical protein
MSKGPYQAMNSYLVLIQNNAITAPSEADWERFFTAAQKTGWFQGGSALGRRTSVGNPDTLTSTAHLAGYMRFDAPDHGQLLDLLKDHPVVQHGGTVELCELPKT